MKWSFSPFGAVGDQIGRGRNRVRTRRLKLDTRSVSYW